MSEIEQAVDDYKRFCEYVAWLSKPVPFSLPPRLTLDEAVAGRLQARAALIAAIAAQPSPAPEAGRVTITDELVREVIDAAMDNRDQTCWDMDEEATARGVRAILARIAQPPAPRPDEVTAAEIVAGSDALCAMFHTTFDFWTDRRDYVEAARAVLLAAKAAAAHDREGTT